MDPDIGLKRHTVRLVDHQVGWSRLYELAAAEIRRLAGDLVVAVEHVGSTAVSGLPAKPILDIAVAVPAPETIPLLAERLGAAGYLDRGHAGRDGGHLLVKELAPDVRSVHAHVVEVGDPQWRDYLRFRDTLRGNDDVRRAYAQVKVALAEVHADDRRAYTKGKEAFIRSVLER